MQKPDQGLHILFASLLVWAGLFIACESVAGELTAFIKDQNGRPIEDAILLAKPLGGNIELLPQLEQVDQIDKEFVPRVKVVTVGTTVKFPNKDHIRHHVYSFSRAKIFELPLYSGTSADPVLFDKPGPVTLGCNIHDWMLDHIYIADTPYYGKSAGDGIVTITDLPAGEYSLRVWHQDMKGGEEATIRIETLDSQAVSMEWQLNLKPVFKIPRSVGGAGASYR